MGGRTAFCHCLFAAGDTFKNTHALLHELIGLDIHQIGAWQAVLSDQDGLTALLKV